MYIPIIRGENLKINVKEIAPKVLETIKKADKEDLIPELKKHLNNINSRVFAVDFQHIAGYEQVFGLNGKDKIIFFVVDKHGIISYGTHNALTFSNKHPETGELIDIDVDNAILKAAIEKSVKKTSFSEASPYSMNTKIAELTNKLFNDVRHENSRVLNNMEPFLFFKYMNMYKNEAKYFVSYFKNRLFAYVDKTLFKDLYSYHLHYEGTQIYNFIKKANKTVRDNFFQFKKEHNFLSMFFADQKKAVFNTCLNNYESIIDNIAIDLNVSSAQLEPLKNCSYNDFLYIKTPKKYFKILSKFDLKVYEKLSLQQIKFLNELVYKNNTFVKREDVEKVLYDPALLAKFMKVFQIRKSLKMGHNQKDYYNNIDEYIRTSVAEFETQMKDFGSSKKANKKLSKSFITYIDEKKVSLIPTEKSIVFESIKNYVLEGRKGYSNLQYWDEIITHFSSYLGSETSMFTFILKENRQEHVLFLSVDDKNISFNDQTLTPRIGKLLKEMFSTQEFIDYVFNNILFDKKMI